MICRIGRPSFLKNSCLCACLERLGQLLSISGSGFFLHVCRHGNLLQRLQCGGGLLLKAALASSRAADAAELVVSYNVEFCQRRSCLAQDFLLKHFRSEEDSVISHGDRNAPWTVGVPRRVRMVCLGQRAFRPSRLERVQCYQYQRVPDTRGRSVQGFPPWEPPKKGREPQGRLVCFQLFSLELVGRSPSSTPS